MKRPTEKEGRGVPWVGLVGLGLVLVGAFLVRGGQLAGGWVVSVGAGLVIMFCLLFWRLVAGGILSTGLWFGLVGVFWLAHPGLPHQELAPLLLITGLLIIAGTVAYLARRSFGSQGMVRRLARRSSRKDGVASWWDVWRRASVFTLRRKAKILRPSLRDVSWWARWFKTPATELGTCLARIGRQRVWSAIENVTLRFGGPRMGKSGELAGRILDAPGAVITTSTRTDLIDNTELVRGKVGPLYVFNPSGLAGLESTLTFDPLAGCGEPHVAIYRAEDLISGGPSTDSNADREFWMRQGAQALAAMMHAAALGGFDMLDVQRWVAAPTEFKDLVLRQLRRSPSPAFEAQAVQFFDNNDRTRSSITTTILPALSWLTSDVARDAARPGDSIDVEKLLEEKGTLYLLGAEDSLTAPLVTALTAHIAREARRIASEQRSGRLDPPLTLVLDEAALICPIPLDRWTADMGGRNITIHIGAQGRAQLRARYGDTGAATILNNAAMFMIMGGARDDGDLAAYTTLVGERDHEVATHDHSSRGFSTTSRRQQTLSDAQVAQLAEGEVVIIGRAMPPALGKLPMVWKRRDVRKATRAKKRAARAAARLNRQIDMGRPRLVEISWRAGWDGFRQWLANLRPVDRFVPTVATTRRVGETPVSPTDFDTDAAWPTGQERHLVVVPPAEDEAGDQR